MSREIRVVSSQFDTPKKIESSATTWGQLKSELSSENINYTDMTATVKETRNSLSMDDAVLPEGDFAIFLSPSKVKSGNIDSPVAEEVEAEGFRVLRSYTTSLGINAGANPTKAQLATIIAAYNLGRGNDSNDTTGINPQEIQAANESLLAAIESIKEIAVTALPQVEETNSEPEMDDEDAALMNEFKEMNG